MAAPKKETPEELFEKLRKQAEDSLRAAYPGKDVKVVLHGESRDIIKQNENLKKGRSQKATSLHFFGGARDYNIIIDGKVLGNTDEDRRVYKEHLWSKAKKMGLYHLDETGFGKVDPYHIGLVEERGDGTAFQRLFRQYPDLLEKDSSKKIIQYAVEHKNKNPKDTTYDAIITAYNDSVKSKPAADWTGDAKSNREYMEKKNPGSPLSKKLVQAAGKDASKFNSGKEWQGDAKSNREYASKLTPEAKDNLDPKKSPIPPGALQKLLYGTPFTAAMATGGAATIGKEAYNKERNERLAKKEAKTPEELAATVKPLVTDAEGIKRSARDFVDNNTKGYTLAEISKHLPKHGFSKEQQRQWEEEVRKYGQEKTMQINSPASTTAAASSGTPATPAPSPSTPGPTTKAGPYVAGTTPKTQTPDGSSRAEKTEDPKGDLGNLDNTSSVIDPKTGEKKSIWGVGQGLALAQFGLGLAGASKYSKLAEGLIRNTPIDTIPLEASDAYIESKIATNKAKAAAEMGLSAARKAEYEAKIERTYAADVNSSTDPLVRRTAALSKYDAILGLASADEAARSANEQKYAAFLQNSNQEAARMSAYRRQIFEDRRRKWEAEYGRALSGEQAGAQTQLAGLTNLFNSIQIKEIENNKENPVFNFNVAPQ